MLYTHTHGYSFKEIWKDIYGYEGKYQVSNTGKVRSLNYNNTGQVKELKQKTNRYGYMEVKLSKNNKTKDFMVGRLVAMHFLPNFNFKEQVMHLKSATDNSVENLKWGYYSEVKHNMYNRHCRSNSKGTNTKITFNGKNYRNYKAIAIEEGINVQTFYTRMRLGWSIQEALNVPVGRRNNE